MKFIQQFVSEAVSMSLAVARNVVSLVRDARA